MLSSVTSFWGDASDTKIKASLPAHVPVSLTPESDEWEHDETWESDELQESSGPEADALEGMAAESEGPVTVAVAQADENRAGDGENEEETQEMDALLEPRTEDDRGQTG